MPTIHDSEDDCYEKMLNSNVEQDEQEVIEKHCSAKSADAANSPPVEIDSIKKLQLFLQTELVVTQGCAQVLKNGGYIKVC